MLKDSKAIKVLHFQPVNNREHALVFSLQRVIDSSCSIDRIHTCLYNIVTSDDLNPIFGFRPSEFYDFEMTWYHIRLYHKKRDGRRHRIVLTICLSGMEKHLPKPDLDPICRTQKTA